MESESSIDEQLKPNHDSDPEDRTWHPDTPDSAPEFNINCDPFEVKGIVRFDSNIHDGAAIAGMSPYLQTLILRATENNPTCHTVITQTKPWPGDTREDLIALMAAKGLKVIK